MSAFRPVIVSHWVEERPKTPASSQTSTQRDSVESRNRKRELLQRSQSIKEMVANAKPKVPIQRTQSLSDKREVSNMLLNHLRERCERKQCAWNGVCTCPRASDKVILQGLLNK